MHMAAQGADDLPEEVQSWIGQERYSEKTEFPIEMGYVLTTLSATQNGNPLYWDEKVADELTGGPITLPTMASVWFRPHDWSPGRTEPAVALQLHFDLKDRLGLPEAVMSDNTMVFYEPIRPGDQLTTTQILYSVSSPKTTKLGTGRFWDFGVRFVNQRGELCAEERYTGFGYNRPASEGEPK
jgi:hypothetical protein